MPLLSLLIFLPALGGLALLLLPEAQNRNARPIGLAVSVATLLLTLAVLVGFKSDSFHFQYQEYAPWIDALGIHYRLGVDGISVWMIVLTALLGALAAFASGGVTHRPRAFYANILFTIASILGSFLALDLIVFFTFFEAMLLPTYFLISIWGGSRRQAAAAKFLIFTFAGSIFMLLGMAAIAGVHRMSTGRFEFGIQNLQALAASGNLWVAAPYLEFPVFWAFAIGLLVKTPAFPFHSWIADTYAESPIATPILSSVMVKLGAFGMFRFLLPLFPSASVASAPIMMGLGVLGILYGAIVAAVQPDIRRMMAYSSVSHMGFIILGIFSLANVGLAGANFQMFAHGISTGALLFLVGILYARYGTTRFADYGGLKAQMPVFAALFLLAMLGSIALPSTNGFIGEFFALMGAFESGFAGFAGLSVAFAVAAGLGAVLGAVYLLYMFQQVFYGPARRSDVTDVSWPQAWPAAALAILIFLGGIVPGIFTDRSESALAAARLMATAPPGLRPVWTNDSDVIVTTGPQRGDLQREGVLILPARPYPRSVAATAEFSEESH